MRDNIRQDSSKHSGSGPHVSGDATAGHDQVFGDQYKIKIVGSGKETRHPIQKENNILLELIAPILIDRIGQSKLKWLGGGSLIAFIVSFIVSYSSFVNSLNPEYGFLKFIPPSSGGILYITFGIPALLLIIGLVFIGTVKFYHSSKCPNCSKDYVFKETGNSFGIQVETAEGYWDTPHRIYKCRSCGYGEEIIGEPDFIDKKEQKD
jgi:hypothetical protein